MTDFRALCAELLSALENAIRVIYNEDGTKHISTADPVIAKADAALAQPEPVGPTDEELREMWLSQEWFNEGATFREFASIVRRWGRPAIEPVPVAERLPGPEDCDAEGCCWAASEDCPAWHRVSRHFDAWHYWLPHHALPVPQQEVK